MCFWTQLLGSAEADLTVRNGMPDMQTALDLADELEYSMIIRLLEDHGALRTGRRAYDPSNPTGAKLPEKSQPGELAALLSRPEVKRALRPAFLGLVAVYGFGVDWKVTLGVTVLFLRFAPQVQQRLQAALAGRGRG